DFHVTGVQTCALPIYFNFEEEPGKENKKGRPSLDKAGMAQLVKSLIEEEVILPFDEDKPLEDYTIDDYKELFSLNIKERENKARSEERRVGKGGRSGR